MLTRDSIFWWLGIIGAVLVYLGNADSPATWSWNDWMQTLAFVVATISGKLATSPLKGSGPRDQAADGSGGGPPSSRLLMIVVAIGLALPLAACSAKSKTTLVKADYTLYQSVKAISDTEIVLSRAGMLTPAQSLRINEALLPAAKLGLEATQALRAWQPGQPLPPQLPRLVRELGDISRIIVETAAKPEARAGLLEKVALAQQAVLVVLALGVGVS
jgi:hypothetical protein